MRIPQGIIRSQLETTTELPEARENVRYEAEIGLKNLHLIVRENGVCFRDQSSCSNVENANFLNR